MVIQEFIQFINVIILQQEKNIKTQNQLLMIIVSFGKMTLFYW